MESRVLDQPSPGMEKAPVVCEGFYVEVGQFYESSTDSLRVSQSFGFVQFYTKDFERVGFIGFLSSVDRRLVRLHTLC